MARVIVALDRSSAAEALRIVDALGEEGDYYKVGLQLFTAEGPNVVRVLKERGKQVFLDLKLHDIPNTVAHAVRSARDLGVDMLTVHTAGGLDMMRAAAAESDDRMTVLGVTVLTSLTVTAVEEVWAREISALVEEVVRLGGLAGGAGLGGVVASPLEARALRRSMAEDFVILTPGIRFADGDRHDQARVSTPSEAVAAGADYLVVGRAITEADDPPAALLRARDEITLPDTHDS